MRKNENYGPHETLVIIISSFHGELPSGLKTIFCHGINLFFSYLESWTHLEKILWHVFLMIIQTPTLGNVKLFVKKKIKNIRVNENAAHSVLPKPKL